MKYFIIHLDGPDGEIVIGEVDSKDAINDYIESQNHGPWGPLYLEDCDIIECHSGRVIKSSL